MSFFIGFADEIVKLAATKPPYPVDDPITAEKKYYAKKPIKGLLSETYRDSYVLPPGAGKGGGPSQTGKGIFHTKAVK